MISEEEQIARENNKSGETTEDMTKTSQEFAIYDNGDVKTKNNQLVMKIEKNDFLDEAERERLLQSHESRLHNIDGMLENEKRKQEHELDRALKERLDRRHRLREKQHGKDIRKEEAAVEENATEQLEAKKAQAKERLN